MTTIPTWKLFVPVVPVAAMMAYLVFTGVVRPGPFRGDWSQFFGGLYFLCAGVWLAVISSLWPRLTPGFRDRWRPPDSRATPVLLSAIFSVVGIGLMVTSDMSAPLHIPGLSAMWT